MCFEMNHYAQKEKKELDPRAKKLLINWSEIIIISSFSFSEFSSLQSEIFSSLRSSNKLIENENSPSPFSRTFSTYRAAMVNARQESTVVDTVDSSAIVDTVEDHECLEIRVKTIGALQMPNMMGNALESPLGTVPIDDDSGRTVRSDLGYVPMQISTGPFEMTAPNLTMYEDSSTVEYSSLNNPSSDENDFSDDHDFKGGQYIEEDNTMMPRHLEKNVGKLIPIDINRKLNINW